MLRASVQFTLCGTAQACSSPVPATSRRCQGRSAWRCAARCTAPRAAQPGRIYHPAPFAGRHAVVEPPRRALPALGLLGLVAVVEGAQVGALALIQLGPYIAHSTPLRLRRLQLPPPPPAALTRLPRTHPARQHRIVAPGWPALLVLATWRYCALRRTIRHGASLNHRRRWH
jgi:hypothetical protein